MNTFQYQNNIYKDFDNNNQNEKLLKIEKTLYETQLNSKKIIKNIKNYSNNKNKKEKKDIKKYLNKSTKCLKKFEHLFFDEKKKNIEVKKKDKLSKINYYELFEPIQKSNISPLKLIKLNQKIDESQIWIKRSTANLLTFGQTFCLMDDEKFFKNRQRFIKEYPGLEREANIIKYNEKEKQITHKVKKLVKNKKIINRLFKNNKLLFRNDVYRK